MDLDWLLAVMPYGEQWRQSRKLLHAHVHAGAAVAYQPAQLASARHFVCDLLTSETTRPVDRLSDAAKAVLPRMIRTNFGLTAIRMTYGIDISDPASVASYINTPEGVLQAVNEAGIPGRFLVDFFPLC
jgi:cytochrome P450